jgi:hypothetical protein
MTSVKNREEHDVIKFRLNIVFSGIDFDDDEVFQALAERPHILWRSQSGVSYATAIVDARSALTAAEIVTKLVMNLVPTAQPIRLDEDLVSISDVASRVGVTREAVRNWANGTRHANFPLPRGVVGDQIRVWAWADVNGWLRKNLSLGDVETFPTAHDAALIDAMFAEVRERQSLAVLMSATWSVSRTAVMLLAKARTKPRPSEPSTWVESSHMVTNLSTTLDREDVDVAVAV